MRDEKPTTVTVALMPDPPKSLCFLGDNFAVKTIAQPFDRLPVKPGQLRRAILFFKLNSGKELAR
jgi:hypothetical protein